MKIRPALFGTTVFLALQTEAIAQDAFVEPIGAVAAEEQLLQPQTAAATTTRTQQQDCSPNATAPGCPSDPADETATAAQQSSQQETGDIIVSGARSRAQAVQDTPVAVSVVSAKQIEDRHLTDIADLNSVVPNMNVQVSATNPGAPSMNLRGISYLTSDPATEPSIASFIDGIYLSTVHGALSDLFDVEHVEVLRGPQGIFLGKNAAAGATMITRTRPTGKLGGKASLEYGNYDLFHAQALVNFPIVEDRLAGKIFGSVRRIDGYMKALIPGENDRNGGKSWSLRGALLFTPTDELEVYASTDYQRLLPGPLAPRSIAAASGPTAVSFCMTSPAICAPDDPIRTTQATFEGPSRVKDNLNVLDARYNFGPAKLVSITGHRRHEQRTYGDFDASPLTVFHAAPFTTRVNDWSQEVRLGSEEGGGLDLGGKLNWLIGGYVFGGKSGIDAFQELAAPTGQVLQRARIKRKSQALFAFAEYEIAGGLSASFGTRQSWDHTRHRFNLRQSGWDPKPLDQEESDSWDNLSHEGGVKWEITPDQMIYARYSEGYRGGGFTGRPATLAAAVAYGPETSVSKEIGARTDWFDRRVRINLTLFNVDYDDLQVATIRVSTLPNGQPFFSSIVSNAATARTSGVELETIFKPVPRLTFTFNGGYLNAKYKEYFVFNPVTGATDDRSGRKFINTPKYTAYAGAEYVIPLSGVIDEIQLNASYDWRSKYFTDPSNAPVSLQTAFGLVDASVAVKIFERYTLSAWVRNAFDQYYVYQTPVAAPLFFNKDDAIGRTMGVNLRVNF